MKDRRNRKPVTRRLRTSLLGAGACFAVAASPAFAGEVKPGPAGQTQTESGTSIPQPSAEKPAAVTGGASGMMIYVDPQTGKLLKEPAPGYVPLELSPQLQHALSTSHDGLVETPSSEPGGGFRLDLQGRFQSPLFGTIDADGKLKMLHLKEPSESGDKK